MPPSTSSSASIPGLSLSTAPLFGRYEVRPQMWQNTHRCHPSRRLSRAGEARLVPSPSWFKNNTNINSEKIICWEHLNFADQIIAELDKVLQRQSVVH